LNKNSNNWQEHLRPSHVLISRIEEILLSCRWKSTISKIMKRTLTLFACVAVCCAMMVSCKNRKITEPTSEEIQAQKVALADSVLAEIDNYVDEFITDYGNCYGLRAASFELTEAEKLVKPDYLLEPSMVNEFVTKTQKANALTIYIVELGVREMYGMPLDETKEAITKLAIDVNFPFDADQYEADVPLSERIKAEYEKCKESGDVAFFWQFQSVITLETGYIVSQNPVLFFNKITEEQWQAYVKMVNETNNVMRELAKYDKEMADVLEMFNQNRLVPSDGEWAMINTSIESAKQFNLAQKDKFIAKRDALLQ